MKLRMAFMGFRHGHIMGVYNTKRDDLEIVGACEEHAETRAELKKSGKANITHDNFGKMLDELDFDVLAVGDYYGRRGAIIIEALKRGKHVISDKPVCTRLNEINEIERLAKQKRLAVGCQFDLRSNGIFIALKKLIADGLIGEVHAISFGGQHALSYGVRASWYFEEGKHGGTINDIAIHGFDAIPWLTGMRFSKVDAARNWNAGLKQVPHFKDAAQMMLTMQNGCGVLSDVSYLTPAGLEYSFPLSWRFTLWGTGGAVEASLKTIVLYENRGQEPRTIAPLPSVGKFYLNSFLRDVCGELKNGDLTTGEVIRASRNALLTQKAADEGLHDVALE